MQNIAPKRLDLFPISAKIEKTGTSNSLSIAGCNLASLAEEYGTPLYLYDRETLDRNVSEYMSALEVYYPGESGISYAGKAFLCTAIVQWTQIHRLWLDCSSDVEIAIALAGKAPESNILLHGVNKSPLDLQWGMQSAGTLVVDHLTELNQIIDIQRQSDEAMPDLWLRLRPGVSVDTHTSIQTGQTDSKFGMGVSEALELVGLCLEQRLPLTGVHFHLGSHFHDPSPLSSALDIVLDFIREAFIQTGWLPKYLSPGGGWGVAYHENDLPQPSITEYIQYIATHLVNGCQERDIPLPKLQIEPGRSLVARAGVALYRVGAVKTTLNRRWILVDGGMADNPRPALYGARYSALPVNKPERPTTGLAWIGGRFCESGDILISDLPMPEIAPGELLAIPASGAYQISMSSNYNGALRPAVLWLEDGQARLIQARERSEDLLRRDLPLTML